MMNESDDWKEQLLTDFRGWLEQVPLPDSDSPPDGNPFPWDWHDLVCELAAFRQEVKFQNREQARALREITEAKMVYEREAGRHRNEAGSLVAFEQHVARRAEDHCLKAFLDVRDALVRGREETDRLSSQALATPTRKMKRRRLERKMRKQNRVIRKQIKAMIEGYDHSLRRFDRALSRFDAVPVGAVGEPFDPRTMCATRTASGNGVADGVVVDETRTGFVRDDRVLRAAEVTVIRN